MAIIPTTLNEFVTEVQGILKSTSASADMVKKYLGTFLEKDYLNIIGDTALPDIMEITLNENNNPYLLTKNIHAIHAVMHMPPTSSGSTTPLYSLKLMQYPSSKVYAEFFRDKSMTEKGTPEMCIIFVNKLHFYPHPEEETLYKLIGIFSLMDYSDNVDDAIYAKIPKQYIEICLYMTAVELGHRLSMPEERLFVLRDKAQRVAESIRQRSFVANRGSGVRATC